MQHGYVLSTGGEPASEKAGLFPKVGDTVINLRLFHLLLPAG